MANCENYQRLLPMERYEFVGKVVHALQNDNQSFHVMTAIVNDAQKRGVFNDVIINPPTEEPESY